MAIKIDYSVPVIQRILYTKNQVSISDSPRDIVILHCCHGNPELPNGASIWSENLNCKFWDEDKQHAKIWRRLRKNYGSYS